MKLKLKDILPNPDRDLKRNPLDEGKLKELVDSINDTGFWDNVVVRRNKAGRYESAYGHHRIAAAIKAGLTEADFIVKDFDDEMMIKVMGRENSDAYQYSILALLEKVRAVVMGLSEGRIKPFTINSKTPADSICYAPSFVPGASSDNLSEHLRYTITHVAQFLGMAFEGNDKAKDSDMSVRAAIGALRLIQTKKMTEQEIKDLKVNQLLKLVRDRADRHEVIRTNEAKKAEDARVAGLSLQQQVDRANAEKAKAQAEADRLHKARMAATKKEDEEKAESIKAEQKANRLKQELAEKKLKAAQREWDANEKSRLAAVEHQRSEAAKAAQRAEASRASYLADHAHAFDRIGSADDPLYERSKSFGRDKRTTEPERVACIAAIEGACERLMQLRVFFRPELGKKKR